jgi:hypothetical protein
MASSEMLRRVARTRATRRTIPEDAILHNHRRENRKSSIKVLVLRSCYTAANFYWTSHIVYNSKFPDENLKLNMT